MANLITAVAEDDRTLLKGLWAASMDWKENRSSVFFCLALAGADLGWSGTGWVAVNTGYGAGGKTALYLGVHQHQWVLSCTPDLPHPPGPLGCVCLPRLLRGTISVDLAVLNHTK